MVDEFANSRSKNRSTPATKSDVISVFVSSNFVPGIGPWAATGEGNSDVGNSDVSNTDVSHSDVTNSEEGARFI